MASEPQGGGFFQRAGRAVEGTIQSIFRDPTLVGFLSQAFPEFRAFMATPQGQALVSGAATADYRAAEQEALDILRESNEQGARIVDEVLLPMVERAQAIGEEAAGLGKEFFDPNAAVRRFRQATRGVREGLEALPGEVRAGTAAVQHQFGAVGRDLATGAADINRRFGASLETARGLVSTLGEAERQDINRRFTETGSELQMGLSARGLGGSTISSSIGTGVERERATALLGLQEQTARQRLGVEETFGLAGLGARERLLGAGINLGAQRAGALQFGNQLFAGTSLGALGARGNLAAGEVGAFDQAALNRINSILAAGGFTTGAQLGATGQALDFRGQFTIPFPTPPQF